ncbi:MAG: insulinase family protein [Cryobacterium sp.]|nr:insulinase family protein [Oligoflexia bacterium]
MAPKGLPLFTLPVHSSSMSKFLQPELLSLSNGIPLILQNNDSPVASIYWWVKTGSADEKPAEAGFAHFLEHMHFKDTDAKTSNRASTGEMARLIESLGGDINAYTSFDQTVYHVTCAAHHWEKVLKVFGTMAKPQRFLKEDFQREREVILEELKKNEDSPNRMLFQSLFTSTFSKHPYGRPVIGFTKTLKDAKVGNLEAFYRRQYVSGNMGLILVGPFEEKRKKSLVKILDELFGKKKIPKKPPVKAERVQEVEIRSHAKFNKVPFDVTTPTMAFSFRVPDLRHPDMPALDLLGGILGMGEMGRLYQALFYGKSIVNDVGGGVYVPRDPGMLYFTADADSVEKLPEIFSSMLDELNRIQTDGPTDEELARVVTNTESERYYALQSADGIASRLGFLKYQLGDLNYDDQYLSALKGVDAEKVQEVAARYFDLRRMSFSVMVPKKDKDFDLKPMFAIAEDKLGGKGESSKPKAAKVAKRKIGSPIDILPERITLPSGVRVLFRERKSSHVMSIQAAVLGGLRLEVADPVTKAELDIGASNLLSGIWAKGTHTKSSNEITTLIENAAANLDGFSGRNTIGLASSGLARDWTKLSTLFSEVLLEPAFPKDELDLSKKVVEDAIKSIEDHSSALCSKLFHEALFENHPYGKYAAGTIESLASIDSDRLKAFHEKWVQPERLVVSVVGNISRKKLDPWLESLDASFQARKKSSSKPLGLASIGDEPETKGPRWIERSMGREQVHIITGGLGLRFSDDDRYAVRLLQNVLGGQSGRLFIELREKRSMAYSVAPISMEGIERGYIGTYIGCSPSKKDEAIAGIKKVLEDLANKGPTESEMRRAKEYYLGRRVMDLQGDGSLAGYYALESVYDLPIRTETEIVKKIEAVTAKAVREACRKFYVEANTVTATVG